MVEYDFYVNTTRKLYEWISQQPNLVSIAPYNEEKIYCVFNHNAAQQEQFKEDLIERLFTIDVGNNTFELLLPQLRQIRTDQLFYKIEFPPNAGITKTDIGTTFTNIFTDFGGRPFFIDTKGFKSMAIQILWNKGVGSTGTHTMRIVDDADNTQVVASGSLGTTANSSDDFTNVTIPQAFMNFKGKWRLQARSTVAGDDPIFYGFRLYLRRD